MGRAARWLRVLLGWKRADSGGSPADPPKEKKRWCFVKSFREKGKQEQGSREPPPLAAAVGAEERNGSYRELARSYGTVGVPASVMLDEEEQNKRAIAVAAATAAVADAAVAAAQAAAAVVRLTSSGRGGVGFAAATAFGKREESAAVRIQSAFRGYLARRALRALKGLVKLQALVRGNIVRKQAAETLRCMQALVRVQARARACRALQSERSRFEKVPRMQSPPTPEKQEQNVRGNIVKPDRSGGLKRNSSKPTGMDIVDRDRVSPVGWNWLDQWMEERYWESRESTRKAGLAASMDDEKNAKILEVDTGKPQFSHKKRSNYLQSSCSTLTSDHNSRSFATVPDSPSKDSTVAQQSAPSPSSVEIQQSLSPLRFPVESGDYADSPQFYSALSRPGSSRRGSFTPSKSECSRSLFSGYSDYPNYMANTQSSRAKVRSHSAPKQRPEFENSGSIKRASAHGFGQTPSAAFSQRSSSLHAKFANKAYPGSGRLDRLGMPIRI